MKKTLITLLALCGATSASATDAELVWDLSFNLSDVTDTSTDLSNTAVVTDGSGAAYTTLTITANDSTVANGICATPSDNRVTISDSASTLCMRDSFSFVVQGGADVAVGDWGVLFGLGENDGFNIKVANSDSGKLTFLPEGYTMSGNAGSTATPYGSMGTYILTVNNGGRETAQDSAALTLYYNGAQVATAKFNAKVGENPNDNHWGNTLGTFALGGRNYSYNNATDFSFTNVQLYSGVLSSTQISQLSAPEPTTATLSLLALAGLAARRRRK